MLPTPNCDPAHDYCQSQQLDVPQSSRDSDANDREENQEPYDHEKRPQCAIIDTEWNRDVHTEETGDDVQGHDNRRKEGNLAENLVCSRALGDAVDGQLSKVVAVGARQHPLKMAKSVHHGDNVILNVTEIEAYFHARSDLVVLVASLREALEHIGLSAEQAHQSHDVLADVAKPRQERMVFFVIWSCSIDVIVESISSILDFCYSWAKVVDNVITSKA